MMSYPLCKSPTSITGRLAVLLLLPIFIGCSAGCAARKAAEQSARTVQHSVDLYQQRLDLLIARQNNYYRVRLAEYQAARQQLFQNGIDQQRDADAAHFASELASDPNKTRIPTLVEFLKNAEGREYELRTTIVSQEQQTAEKFNAAISQLQQQKQLLESVKADLSKLLQKPRLQDQINGLSDYGKEVAADLQKATAQDSAPKN
jgi:hypothetical protein